MNSELSTTIPLLKGRLNSGLNEANNPKDVLSKAARQCNPAQITIFQPSLQSWADLPQREEFQLGPLEPSSLLPSLKFEVHILLTMFDAKYTAHTTQ